MLATYQTYLISQKLLTMLVAQHNINQDVLTIADKAKEDFLTSMRSRRQALAERAELIKANFEKSIIESEKILKKKFH